MRKVKIDTATLRLLDANSGVAIICKNKCFELGGDVSALIECHANCAAFQTGGGSYESDDGSMIVCNCCYCLDLPQNQIIGELIE